MTFNLSEDVVEQARDAFWLARGEYRTLADWVEVALLRHIEETKKAQGVEEIPPRPGPLPVGRPIN